MPSGFLLLSLHLLHGLRLLLLLLLLLLLQGGCHH